MSTDPLPPPIEGSRIAVLGLGRGGLPAAHRLAALGAEVTAWDDREEARAQARAEGVALRDLATADWTRLDSLLLSPGIPDTLPAPHPVAAAARAAGRPILCDVEYLWRTVRLAGSGARFVGVTGTNGKSTTTALIAHLLRVAGLGVAEGGNLGPAALGLPMLASDGVYVLELSSYMLERIALARFDAAVMLNLAPDHLDRHGDMAGYARAKRRVFERQRPGDLAVIGIDDPASRAMAESLEAERGAERAPVRISSGGPVPGGTYALSTLLVDASRGEVVRLASLAGHPTLAGSHNRQNAAAAAAVARWIGVSAQTIAAGLATFAGLPHRQERVGTVDGILFVNDSKATNADAAQRALEACAEQGRTVFWIAGGVPKAGGIESLRPHLGGVLRAFLIGQAAPTFAATLEAEHVAHEIAGTLDRAVAQAFAAAQGVEGAIVLLSPAAASFDQFANFEARGDAFRDLVATLGERR